MICIALLAACGPSGKQYAMAKQARYQGDKLALFNAAKSVTEGKYKLEVSDETTLSMKTITRWYTPEGLVAAEKNSEQNSRGGYNSLYPDNSVSVALVVKLLPEGSNWVVDVEPIMARYHAGSPQTEPLKPNDPSVPGWATGKVDQLYYEIHTALQQYEVKLGGVAPAPAPAAAQAPPAPAPAQAPAPAGSDAPPAPAPQAP